ncbi:MAG: hypothetical protein DRP65_10235 [Planctomycetota bacterium]|nr:MAG: hypothetical protein DRP65_10235 [Planctomycetota bacterium]
MNGYEILKFFSVQIVLIAVVLILHTYIGLHIIRRTLIFSDLVLDQFAAFGAMVGVALGIEYGTATSYLPALIAVLFGALLLGDKLCGGGTYVKKTLAGSMLWVTWPLVVVTAVTYIVLIIFHFLFRDKFISLVERPGTNPNERLWDFLLFTTQGIITVLIVPIAGVLLAYAFLMIPATIAALFTRRWLLAVFVGWLIGFLACVSGVCASYFLNLPYGPTLVLSLGICFVFAVLIRCFRRQPA